MMLGETASRRIIEGREEVVIMATPMNNGSLESTHPIFINKNHRAKRLTRRSWPIQRSRAFRERVATLLAGRLGCTIGSSRKTTQTIRREFICDSSIC